MHVLRAKSPGTGNGNFQFFLFKMQETAEKLKVKVQNLFQFFLFKMHRFSVISFLFPSALSILFI